MKILAIEKPELKSQICNSILRALPQWFGIESALADYTEHVKSMNTWAIQQNSTPVGFISIHQHNAASAEVHVMAIIEEYHRRGFGKILLSAAEVYLRSVGTQYLQVKTLSPSHPDKNYACTREFYLKMGFVPLEEFKTLWGAHNPCWLMIKKL